MDKRKIVLVEEFNPRTQLKHWAVVACRVEGSVMSQTLGYIEPRGVCVSKEDEEAFDAFLLAVQEAGIVVPYPFP